MAYQPSIPEGYRPLYPHSPAPPPCSRPREFGGSRGSGLRVSRLWAPPRALKSALLRLQEFPRALQEPFKRLPAGITQLISDLIPLCIDCDSPKATLGPQKSMNSIKKTMFFEEITFLARVASWTRFRTLPGSVLRAFWPSRCLKPLLEFLSERPKAVQEHFFARPMQR